MNQKGFVLVLSLWFLLAMTIIVAAIAANTQLIVGSAQQDKEGNQALWADLSLRSFIIYGMLTGGNTYHGLILNQLQPQVDDMGGLLLIPTGEEIRLDGRPYRYMGQMFSLQDKGGLVGVNTLEIGQLNRLLSAEQLSASQLTTLNSQLWDYIDQDDLLRISGAESWDYKRAGKPEPLNRSLVLLGELNGILSWPSSSQLPYPLLRTEPLHWNINTAPADAIWIQTGASSGAIKAIIDYRQQSYFTHVNQVNRLLGETVLLGDNMDFEFTSSKMIKLSTWRENHRMDIIEITITPRSDTKPWAIERVYYQNNDIKPHTEPASYDFSSIFTQ